MADDRLQQIPLTQGYVTLVDEADFATLARFSWHVKITYGPDGSPRNLYAARNSLQEEGYGTTFRMHRLLIPGAEEVDHINGDGLDNRRANLRAAGKIGNSRNARMRSDNTTGFKGVCWHIRRHRWEAVIQARHIGYFDSADEAARAYDRSAAAIFGDFARLNFPDSTGVA